MKRLYEYTVEGHGEFPFDMLRYDSAWPFSEMDSGLIHQSCHPRRNKVKFSVRLIGLRPPTEARWESFSWHLPHPARISAIAIDR